MRARGSCEQGWRACKSPLPPKPAPAQAIQRIHLHMPAFLPVLAWVCLILGFACAVGIAVHTLRHPQSMWIMSVVWPITGLYLGPLAVHFYRKSLPVSERDPASLHLHDAGKRFENLPPTLLQNLIAVFHCGAGCTLGDIVAENVAPALGLSFGERLLLDFAFAWAFGIAFQYVTIAPMRGLSFFPGLAAAARADTISIALFQAGMCAWMVLTHGVLFRAPHLTPHSAIFWFMMQIAMIAGTFAALPANAWLIRKGWKEKMPTVDPSQLASASAA